MSPTAIEPDKELRTNTPSSWWSYVIVFLVSLFFFYFLPPWCVFWHEYGHGFVHLYVKQDMIEVHWSVAGTCGELDQKLSGMPEYERKMWAPYTYNNSEGNSISRPGFHWMNWEGVFLKPWVTQGCTSGGTYNPNYINIQDKDMKIFMNFLLYWAGGFAGFLSLWILFGSLLLFAICVGIWKEDRDFGNCTWTYPNITEKMKQEPSDVALSSKTDVIEGSNIEEQEERNMNKSSEEPPSATKDIRPHDQIGMMGIFKRTLLTIKICAVYGWFWNWSVLIVEYKGAFSYVGAKRLLLILFWLPMIVRFNDDMFYWLTPSSVGVLIYKINTSDGARAWSYIIYGKDVAWKNDDELFLTTFNTRHVPWVVLEVLVLCALLWFRLVKVWFRTISKKATTNNSISNA